MKKILVSLLLCLSVTMLLTGCKKKQNTENNSEIVSEVVEVEENPTIEEAMSSTTREDLLDNYVESMKIKAYDAMSYKCDDKFNVNSDKPDETVQSRENIYYKSANDVTYYRVYENSTYTYYFKDGSTWYKTEEPFIYKEDETNYTVVEKSELAIKTINDVQYVGFDITKDDGAPFTVLFAYDDGTFVYAGSIDKIENETYLNLYSFNRLGAIEIPDEVLKAAEADKKQSDSFLEKFGQ